MAQSKSSQASKPYLIYVLYLVLSMGAIYFSSATRECARWVMLVDLQINDTIKLLFSDSQLGVNLRQIVSLALTPILIIGIPAVLYQIIKHQTMPYLIQLIWLFWIITALSRLLSQ